MANDKTRFIRKNGKVIPIRGKGGAGGSNVTRKTKKKKRMSNKEFSATEKRASAAHQRVLNKNKRRSTMGERFTSGGIGAALGGALGALGGRKGAAIGAALGGATLFAIRNTSNKKGATKKAMAAEDNVWMKASKKRRLNNTGF